MTTRTSLRTKLTAVISGLVLGILTIVALIVFPFFENHFRNSIRSHQEAVVHAVAQEIDIKIATIQGFLNSLVELADLDDFRTAEAAQKFLEAHNDNLNLFDNSLLVYSPDGTIIAMNPHDASVVGRNFSDRAYYRNTVETGYPYISKPFVSRQQHGHKILLFTHPVFDRQHRLIAILAGSIDLARPNALGALLDIRIGHSGHLILTTSDGERILHTDFEQPSHAIAHVEEEKILLGGGQPTDLLVARHPLTRAAWTLTAIYPTREALAPFRQGRLYFLGLMLIAGLLSLLAVRLLVNQLSWPVMRLTRYAEGFMANPDSAEPFPEPPSRKDELGRLHLVFRAMFGQVRENANALKTQLAFQKTLIDTIPHPIFYKDSEGVYLGGNTAFESYIGRRIEDLIGKSVYDIAPPDLAEIYHQADLDLFAEKGTQTYESQILYADGTLHDVIFAKRVFFDADGEVAGLLGTILDITDRKQAELALKRSEALLHLVLNHSGNGIVALDAERRVIYWNDYLLKLFPFPPELLQDGPKIDDLIRFACRQGIYPPDQEEELILRRIRDLATCTTRQAIETPRLDGVVLEADATPLPDGGHILVFYDITEHKRAEQRLQNALDEAEASRDHIASIIRSIGDGLLVTDSDDRLAILNHIAGDMLHLSADEAIGRDAAGIFSYTPLAEHMQQVFAIPAGASLHNDVEIYHDAPSRILQARSLVMQSSDGFKRGVVTTLIDVTRERELDRMKNEFISTAAHELRTPLTAILGYAELLLYPKEFGPFNDSEQGDFLQEIHDKGIILEQIIDDLLDISRIEQGKSLLLEKEEINLAAMLQKILTAWRVRSRTHTFRLTCDDAVKHPRAFDPHKMTQVFENLLSNAVKYSPQGGEIRVVAQALETQLQIVIEDEGIGMTPSQLERIFEKFYRADQSNTAVGGLGLGMSIVKTIIEAHGGKIIVESELDHGTRIRIDFPLT
ncbi:MAG: hypothetical protein C0621_10005 [Desulfuromonas sp.]|nr:MAG: hypothetical protein C0621_10005 [Desulfuromonas sp.]